MIQLENFLNSNLINNSLDKPRNPHCGISEYGIEKEQKFIKLRF